MTRADFSEVDALEIGVSLQSNKEVVVKAIKQNGLTLEYAADALKADKEIVWFAIEQNPISLKYVSKKLRADKEIVKFAIEQNPTLLMYASKNLQQDIDLFKLVIKQNPDSLMHASEELKDDKEFALFVVKINGNLNNISKTLQSDEEIIFNAIEYGNIKNLLDTIDIKIIENNKKIILYIFKKCKQYVTIVWSNKYYDIHNICLSYYKKKIYYLHSTLKDTNLGINEFIIKIILTIHDIVFNQFDNIYELNITAMSGKAYNISEKEEKLTFNTLSSILKKNFEIQNIVFVIKETTFDIEDYNKNVIFMFTTLMK